MNTMIEFARTIGAKDKKKRNRKRLATVAGGLGGIAVASKGLDNAIEKARYAQGLGTSQIKELNRLNTKIRAKHFTNEIKPNVEKAIKEAEQAVVDFYKLKKGKIALDDVLLPSNEALKFTKEIKNRNSVVRGVATTNKKAINTIKRNTALKRLALGGIAGAVIGRTAYKLATEKKTRRNLAKGLNKLDKASGGKLLAK